MAAWGRPALHDPAVTIMVVRISPKAVIFDYGNVLSESQPAENVCQRVRVGDPATQRLRDRLWTEIKGRMVYSAR